MKRATVPTIVPSIICSTQPATTAAQNVRDPPKYKYWGKRIPVDYQIVGRWNLVTDLIVHNEPIIIII